MRVAVINNCVPFLRGGAEHLAEALTSKLIEYGHEALLVRVPFRWDPPGKILDHMLACRLMRIPEVDRIVALKFPAYYVPHPDKVVWLLHQFRQAYDLWGTDLQGLPDTDEGRNIRDSIIQADTCYLSEARAIFTNSEVTANRLKTFNNLEARVLYPPLLSNTHFHCKDYGDYLFAPGRVNSAKRQHLLVEAVRYCKSNVRLIIAGSEEGELDGGRIDSLIASHNVADRVLFVNRFITENEKADWFSRALGCAYIPYDEDSYGYVTLESYLSNKPVITCTDSGGIKALVKDGATGYVAPPNPAALADAMDRLFNDKPCARRMGEAGNELVKSLRISWDTVVEMLTR